MRKIFACVFLLVAPLLGQARLGTGEAAAGATGPAFEASLGYVYLSMATPSQRVGLTGLDGNGLVRFASRWGATVDATYVGAGNVLGTGHSGECPELSGWSRILSGGARADGDLHPRPGRRQLGRQRGPC